MTHGRHMYAKTYDMAKDTLCIYPQYDHALPNWKCVLGCCADCSYINLLYQEKKARINNTLN